MRSPGFIVMGCPGFLGSRDDPRLPVDADLWHLAQTACGGRRDASDRTCNATMMSWVTCGLRVLDHRSANARCGIVRTHTRTHAHAHTNARRRIAGTHAAHASRSHTHTGADPHACRPCAFSVAVAEHTCGVDAHTRSPLPTRGVRPRTVSDQVHARCRCARTRTRTHTHAHVSVPFPFQIVTMAAINRSVQGSTEGDHNQWRTTRSATLTHTRTHAHFCTLALRRPHRADAHHRVPAAHIHACRRAHCTRGQRPPPGGDLREAVGRFTAGWRC
jgi:hypothetical protein